MMGNSTRLERVLAAIDDANSCDPRIILVDGVSMPANLAYGIRMSSELDRICPCASDALKIGARGQHIERWIIPRGQFAMDKSGYHRWRASLREHHAMRLSQFLIAAGFEQDVTNRVVAIVRKERLREDPEAQALEDVVCIVFLKYELSDFAAKYKGDRSGLGQILAKTWMKMSPRGHEAALALSLPAETTAMLHEGLANL